MGPAGYCVNVYNIGLFGDAGHCMDSLSSFGDQKVRVLFLTYWWVFFVCSSFIVYSLIIPYYILNSLIIPY